MMKEKLTPRWFIIKLTGILFAIYSAYNIFLIVRDGSAMPPVGIFISALVSLLFALLAAFAWTSEVKNVRFMMIRKTVMIIVLLTIFALKLRLVNRVMALLNFSKTQNVLYVAAYFLTLAALLMLFVYYAFILRNLPLYPKASVFLPIAVIIGFVGCVVCEALLFFGFIILNQQHLQKAQKAEVRRFGKNRKRLSIFLRPDRLAHAVCPVV